MKADCCHVTGMPFKRLYLRYNSDSVLSEIEKTLTGALEGLDISYMLTFLCIAAASNLLLLEVNAELRVGIVRDTDSGDMVSRLTC